MTEIDRAPVDAADEFGSFAGRWRGPDDGIHEIARSGDGLRFDSVVDDMSALHGRGTVIDGTAVIDVIDALGNSGRFEVALADDGHVLSGRFSGPMGQTAIRLTRHA
ncbi:MAG: hypothetical protein QNJ12_22130 [Ilumatobacter sp.]|uniref:hypothetical protein n=1 Tax=Ilumatobacter sp. TaxID=1967498 RepID=UPI0026019F2C|nr:hypothetical protein [Ilumatobacter sp.]MDJ0771501.1 hypothetical protein [Ilumatobacter sp.]